MQWLNSKRQPKAPTQTRRASLVHWLPNSPGARSRNSLIAAILLGAALVPVALRASGSETVLQNVRGVVRYGAPGAVSQDLAAKGSVALSERDIASTQADSMGTLTMADSSVIVLGQRTQVEIRQILAGSEFHGKFVIANGKTRFDIRHPSGAVADYTFKTPVAEIAVRGTIGDISVDINDGTRLNVYGTHDQGGPTIATVDTIAGEHFDLHYGEKIWIRYQQGKLVAKQTLITQAEIDRFAEFGPPGTIP